MQKINIQFQTSELTPAPFAYAIQLNLRANQRLSYDFNLEYLFRDQLTEEEILEEGYSLDDNLKFKGELPEIWAQEAESLFSKTAFSNKTELEETEDFWLIDNGTQPAYPKNPMKWSSFLEEIWQAILENEKIEKPLEITIIQSEKNEINNYKIGASFLQKEIKISKNDKIKKLPWSKLNFLLTQIYSGEFDQEKALNTYKKTEGIQINPGDDFWFVLGHSFHINAKKFRDFLKELV